MLISGNGMNGWLAGKFNMLGFQAVALTPAQDVILEHSEKPELRIVWAAVRTDAPKEEMPIGAVRILKGQEIQLQRKSNMSNSLFSDEWETIGALNPVDFVNKTSDDLFAMFEGENVISVNFRP